MILTDETLVFSCEWSFSAIVRVFVSLKGGSLLLSWNCAFPVSHWLLMKSLNLRLFLLDLLHIGIEVGMIHGLSFEIVFEDLIVLFQLIKLGYKREYFIFGCWVLLNQDSNIFPQFLQQIVFVIPLFFENLIITLNKVKLIISLLQHEP